MLATTEQSEISDNTKMTVIPQPPTIVGWTGHAGTAALDNQVCADTRTLSHVRLKKSKVLSTSLAPIQRLPANNTTNNNTALSSISACWPQHHQQYHSSCWPLFSACRLFIRLYRQQHHRIQFYRQQHHRIQPYRQPHDRPFHSC